MVSRRDPEAVLASLREGRFLIVGRAGMDLYPEPPGTRITEATKFTADLGGSAGNIAVAIARHGRDAALVSVLAHDAIGRFVAARLADYGVATDCLCFAEGEDQVMVRNSLALAESRPDDAEVVIYRNNAADMCLTPEHVTGLDLANVAGVVVTGTALSGAPSDKAVRDLANLAEGMQKPVIMDVDYRATAWPSSADAATACLAFARRCDIVVGNDAEFALLAKADATDIPAGESLARELAADGIIVIYKQGGDGCQLMQGTSVQTFGVFPVELAKPFGAGDAFLGTLLARLQDGLGLDAAIREGSAAAALVVSRTGCASAMPDADELAAFIAGFAADG